MLDPAVRDDIERATKAFESELIDFRRALHRYPELGRQEHRTTELLMSRLRAAELHPRVLSCGTGVICDLIGTSGEAPTIGFRGDIDALPLSDRKQVGYRSQIDGVCHACGHDAHTTIVLGTGLVLAELRRMGWLERSVRLIFEPAEEMSPGGALDVLADGEVAGLDHVFALHCDPRLTVGKVGFRAGPITAGADRIKVRMTGPGGHTARPHLTADVVYALGVVITQLPALLSRLADPRSALSVVWGQVHAGAVANAIPQAGQVEGTIRCLDSSVWERAHARIPELIATLAEPYGVELEVEMLTSVPPCVNHEHSTELMRQVAAEMLGTDAVTQTQQSLGGEDFGWILAERPGALARLGVCGEHEVDGADLHQGTFDIDESALSLGVQLFAALAIADLPA
ncbi:MAG: amidohydrolase [Nocardioidaceae bacterium]